MIKKLIGLVFNKSKKDNSAFGEYLNDVDLFSRLFLSQKEIDEIKIIGRADILAEKRPLIYKEIEKKLLKNYFYAINPRQRP